MIPIELITSKDLTKYAKILYVYFAIHDEHYLYNRKEVAKDIKVSAGLLHTALYQLIDDGWIIKHSEKININRELNKVTEFKIKVNRSQTKIIK